MSRSSKILLLGSRGMLGSHVAVALQSRGVGPVVEHSVPRFGGGEEIRDYILSHAPTTVVNCIGYTGPELTEHYRVNGWFPRVIADCCHSLEALFIHVSTNAVFAPDEERRWLPSDPLDPRTSYETSKALGEDTRAHVIRASFIGASPKREGLFDRLRQGLPYSNRRWNGVTADTLARHIANVIVERDGVPSSTREHVHSPGVTTFEEIASALGSISKISEQKRDARLLGGGEAVPDILRQLVSYQGWLCRRQDMGLRLFHHP